MDIEDLVAQCRAARAEADAPQRIAAILREMVAAPAAIRDAVRRRQEGQEQPSMVEGFLNDEDLTIYHLAFPPNLFGAPHDHAGWAVIGVYSGAEGFNIYEASAAGLDKVGRQVLASPAVEILPPALIHDIDNPGAAPSGSIHVYSNRHFDMPRRRIWRDGAPQPEAFSLEKSFAYGMELTRRRREVLGIEDQSAPVPPDLSEVSAGRT